jgi:radical SAM enzyme (TIGR01210 family)
MSADLEVNDRWVRSLRGEKNPVSTTRPYAYLFETERSPNGVIEEVATIFLSNHQCPFHCLMCDLWKNTTPASVKPGDIPKQIEWALDKLPKASTVKLYNSGNFFDTKAIPLADYQDIARLVNGFDRVVVESHPKLINKHTLHFQSLLTPVLEIAMGLETVNKSVLEKLNKQMTLEEFEHTVNDLITREINTRAFILVKPPFQNESQGIFWANRSLEFAFNIGVKTCAVIPTRPGNGAMEEVMRLGQFSPPRLSSLEKVLAHGIGLRKGNVFADLWDIELFSDCPKCVDKRKLRLQQMNLNQEIYPEISCTCD